MTTSKLVRHRPARLRLIRWYGYAGPSRSKTYPFRGVGKVVDWLRTVPVGSAIYRFTHTSKSFTQTPVAEMEPDGIVVWYNPPDNACHSRRNCALSAKQIRRMFR